MRMEAAVSPKHRYVSNKLLSIQKTVMLIVIAVKTPELKHSVTSRWKRYTWSDNKVRERISVKVLNTSLLNTTVVAFKVLPLRSYAPIPAPSPPFKTILELVLWNGLQSCSCITPDVINVIKMPSFQYFLYLREQKKSLCGLDQVNRQCVPTQSFV